MYSKRPRRSSDKNRQDLKDLTPRQAAYLRWVGSLIRALLQAVERGSVDSRWIIGRRKLEDGRNAELTLVAKAPKRESSAGYSRSTGTPQADAKSAEGRNACSD